MTGNFTIRSELHASATIAPGHSLIIVFLLGGVAPAAGLPVRRSSN